MKILHTADLRLGAKFLGLGRAGDKVRAQLKRAWAAVVETAIAEKVDAVVVAGGMFDSPEISRPAVEFVLKEIGRLGTVPVVMIPGWRDHLGKGSLYYHFDLMDRPENLFVLTAERETIELKQPGLTVIGCPATGPRSKESPLAGLQAPKDKLSIVLASGNWNGDNYPITEADVAKTGATYVALGGEMAFKSGTAKKTCYAFSGPPEAHDFALPSPAGIVLVDLEKKPAEARFEPLGVLIWKEEKIKSAEEARILLEKEKGENRLLKIHLAGERTPADPEGEEFLNGFKDQFLFLNLLDERKIVLEKKKYPAQSVAGHFIHLAEEEMKQAAAEEKSFYERVMAAGLSFVAPAHKERA
jgi:DNA repair exonuclease SbcCD nuclease subunit